MNRSTLLKTLVLTVLIQSGLHSPAQDPLIEYYNKDWKVVTQDSAFYYAHFVKNGALYQCTTYHVSNQSLKGIGTVKDTSFAKIVGLFKEYNEKGFLEDSMLFGNDHKIETHFRFWQNGKLRFKYQKAINGKESIEGYDRGGNPVKNFIYVKDAFFKSGEKAWLKYLAKNANTSIRIKDVQDGTQAKVIVLFMINKQGVITDVKVKESSGYAAVDRDAIQVIRSGPAWEPAILYNEPVNVYRLQPMTYTLTSEKANK